MAASGDKFPALQEPCQLGCPRLGSCSKWVTNTAHPHNGAVQILFSFLQSFVCFQHNPCSQKLLLSYYAIIIFITRGRDVLARKQSPVSLAVK